MKKVAKLGEQGDVKEVATGFARNFLIPQGLVQEATEQALTNLKLQREQQAKQAESNLVATEKIAQQLEGQAIEVTAKASDEGRLYGALSVVKIATALKQKGFDVKKDQINAGHIKEVGEHEIVINLAHGLDARITVVVSSE